MKVDPLVRGIYYLFLPKIKRPLDMPLNGVNDSDALNYIKRAMKAHHVPEFGTIYHVKDAVLQELLHDRSQG